MLRKFVLAVMLALGIGRRCSFRQAARRPPWPQPGAVRAGVAVHATGTACRGEQGLLPRIMAGTTGLTLSPLSPYYAPALRLLRPALLWPALPLREPARLDQDGYRWVQRRVCLLIVRGTHRRPGLSVDGQSIVAVPSWSAAAIGVKPPPSSCSTRGGRMERPPGCRRRPSEARASPPPRARQHRQQPYVAEAAVQGREQARHGVGPVDHRQGPAGLQQRRGAAQPHLVAALDRLMRPLPIALRRWANRTWLVEGRVHHDAIRLARRQCGRWPRQIRLDHPGPTAEMRSPRRLRRASAAMAGSTSTRHAEMPGSRRATARPAAPTPAPRSTEEPRLRHHRARQEDRVGAGAMARGGLDQHEAAAEKASTASAATLSLMSGAARAPARHRSSGAARLAHSVGIDQDAPRE